VLGRLRGAVVDVPGDDVVDATRVPPRRRQPRQRVRKPEQARRVHQGQEVCQVDQGRRERMKSRKITPLKNSA